MRDPVTHAGSQRFALQSFSRKLGGNSRQQSAGPPDGPRTGWSKSTCQVRDETVIGANETRIKFSQDEGEGECCKNEGEGLGFSYRFLVL